MANTFNTKTMVWKVTEAATLITEAPGLKVVWVKKVVFIPNAVDDDIVFQDTNSEDAIVLKAGASDASPIHINFDGLGKRVEGLTCSTYDAGTAYVYLG